MNRLQWTLCVLLFCISGESRASEPALRFVRLIVAPALEQEELLAVALDQDIFAATKEGFDDLRLLDSGGHPVPFLRRQVRTARAQTIRNAVPAKQPVVRPLTEGGLEILIELEREDPRVNGLSIVTPLKNFEQRVRVESSLDETQWQPAIEGSLIFDYSRFMDVRSEELRFPETQHRFFRIVVDDVTAEQESELMDLTRELHGGVEAARQETTRISRRPFRIERIEFWREYEQPKADEPQVADYPVKSFHVTQDDEQKQTLVMIETRREPITALELLTPSRNFSRSAMVEVQERRGGDSRWRPLGTQTLTRIQFKHLDKQQLKIPFPESRRPQFRLVIENRDSPPIDVTGIRATGNVYQIVFFAAPGQSYRLAYGNPELEAARYDTVAIDKALGEGIEPRLAVAGDEQPLAAIVTEEMSWSDLLSDKRFLLPAVAVLVVLLGWGLYHAAGRVQDLPTEP
jgi:hypothetical protein